MFTVGLTGGIASGKSVVLKEAARFADVETVQADRVAWELYEPGKEAYEEILDIFGEEILEEGRERIDRGRLAEIVFSSPPLLDELEAVVHPRVMEELKSRRRKAEREGKKLFVIEAALIFQSQHVDLEFFDFIVTVRAPEEERIGRLKERDGLDREEALRRIKRQRCGEREDDGRSDFLIDSKGKKKDTERAAREIFSELLRRVEARN